jgi:hypothetical protein
MNCSLISDELLRNGFSFFHGNSISRREIELFAGSKVLRIEQDVLIPRKFNKENPGAWSNLYSDQEFPLHTDFAYQKLPPKYIVLHCVKNESSNRPTYILDRNSIPPEVMIKLSRVLWKIRHPEQNGTIRIFSKPPNLNQEILRYDPTCMTPYFRKDRWAIELLNSIYERYSEMVFWNKDKILVLDNWRCLHGRGTNTFDESKNEKRVLERHSVYI